jgi:hypothetical protein
MIDEFEQLVKEPNLLRVMIQIRNWEGCHHNELKTLSQGKRCIFELPKPI